MHDHGVMPRLFAVDCSECGRPTVTSEINVRPDLCHPCFTATLTATTP
jgi:endogenous inhibitor of DNA gyrase (YacG/DUF329 family)